MPPKPDILIATNNQCNTLPTWWNILAQKYQVPLIILDYPGEGAERASAYDYVTAQHKALIAQLEALSGSCLNLAELDRRILNSQNSVEAWNRVVELLPLFEIPPTILFDSISFLITARSKEETAELYHMLAQELQELPAADQSKIPLFWLGYPLWYHPKRYLEEMLEGCRISGSNYITWWSLNYSGENVFEKLFTAYNDTFLNLTRETKRARLAECIQKSGAKGAVVLHNKSCKCDFVSARQIELPQVELEIDMIDRAFINTDKARKQLEQLMEILCTA